MPTCSTCISPTPISYEVQYFYNDQCSSCSPQSSSCDCTYKGANLTCSGIETGDTLEEVLIKLDSQICAVTGDYSTYQYNCLTPSNTEAEFVDSITDYVCNLTTTLTTFTGTTYPAYQATVNSRFNLIEVPGITCATASVVNTDTLVQVLNKYCTKMTSLTTAISLSGITWNACYTVSPTPSTIAEGFSEVLSQICQTKALIASSLLPTFNNSSNCLAGTTTDSLATTIDLLTTKVCLAPSFVAGSITTSCLTLGSTLQTAVQAIVTKVDTLTQNVLAFSGDFVVTATDAMNPCAGKTIALATPLNQDRFVASNNADVSPGTLISKLQAGTNISLDDITTAGKVIINATGVDRRVSAATGDTSPGFLVDKLEGSTINGITIVPVYNAVTGKVTLQLSVDSGFCTAVQDCFATTGCLSYRIYNPQPTPTVVTWDSSCTSGTVTTETLTLPVSDLSIVICAKIGSISPDEVISATLGACAEVTPP